MSPALIDRGAGLWFDAIEFPRRRSWLGTVLPVTQMAESQQALLTLHSELAFLVRTFFFVMIGAVAQLGIQMHLHRGAPVAQKILVSGTPN